MLKLAVVGCGYWGKNLVRNFYELGCLNAICDENTANAQDIAQQYGNVPILTIEQILESKSINAVAIAAPAVMHAELAARFLKAGKHVFVEKPLSVNLNDAKNLQILAEEHGKILMVGHLLQYHPAYLKVKQLVQEGKVGALEYIYSHRLSLGKIRTEEDVLWSFAPHDISMILGILDDLPLDAKASLSSGQGRGIADYALVNMSFKNGVKGHVFVSWLHPFKEQRLVVQGTKGSLVFDDTRSWEEKITFYPSSINFEEGIPQLEKGSAELIAVEAKEPLKNECQSFIDCIEKNKAPVTDAQEAIRVLTVLDTVSKSIGSQSNPMNYFKHESSYVDEGATIGSGTKICTLYPTNCFMHSLPIKFFEYMNAGLPMIVSKFPFWQSLLKDIDNALFVDPFNPNEIQKAIRTVLADNEKRIAMGERGLSAVKEVYNWNVEKEKLISFYKTL